MFEAESDSEEEEAGSRLVQSGHEPWQFSWSVPLAAVPALTAFTAVGREPQLPTLALLFLSSPINLC